MKETVEGRYKGSPSQNQADEVKESCVVSFGMVAQLELEDIPRVLKYIQRLPNSRIIYQTKGLGHIRIVKE